MSEISENNISTYEVPAEADSISAAQDGDILFIFGFKTHRKVFSELGFLALPADHTLLTACGKAFCDKLKMEPLLNAMTITPNELLTYIPEDLQKEPEAERRAALVLAAVHQAVTNYAGKKE